MKQIPSQGKVNGLLLAVLIILIAACEMPGNGTAGITVTGVTLNGTYGQELRVFYE